MSNKTSAIEQYLGAKKLVSVYKTPLKDEMYLYVQKGQDLQKLDDALLQVFQQPSWVMDLLLTSQKQLARVATVDVLKNIAEKGYFLQMPPPKEDDEMLADYKPRIG